MNEYVSWLHLTDLHFGQARKWLWPSMRQNFKDELAMWVDKVGPWDIVFFSGDFVQSGSQEEYQKLTEELLKLWEHLGTLGSKPVLVGVPGNHDLVRPGDTNPVSRQSHRWHEDNEEAVREEFWSNAKCLYRETIVQALSNYTDWMDGLPVPQPERRSGILPGDFSAVLTVRDLKLGVVGLNTTYLQLASGNYEGKLDVHTRQLLGVCNEDPNAWRKDADLAILMTHQPPSWLYPKAQEHLSIICESERFNFHLCGHLHEAVMRDVREAGGPTRRLRQGPSLFGLEEYGSANKERLLFGYSLGRWTLDGTEGAEIVWPRLANKTVDGRVILGPNTNLQLSIDSSVTTPFHTERRQRVDLSATESVRARGGEQVRSATVPTGSAGEQRIVLIEKPIEVESARLKLKNVPRFRAKAESQHRVVRTDEQASLAVALREHRKVWLVSDWAYGKDGFIAAALEQLGDKGTPKDVFLLQCGGVDNSEALQAATETQLGLSLQEFLAAAAALPYVVLIFDDLPSTVVLGEDRAAFERIIVGPIIDFCPEMRLVFVVRQEPPNVNPNEVVRLKPFDIYEIRNYIQHHSQSQTGLDDVDTLAHIQRWSEGLPMQLDKLLEDLQLFSLNEILEEDVETPLANSAAIEPVPRALRQAVAQLSSVEAEQSRTSFKLLKVLTVLRDGEIFQSIKRFYQREPFHPQNVVELTDLGLLEVVPIAQTAADLTLYAGRRALPSTAPAKLLRVPRQVRDYISTLISADERAAIIQTSTELLFGNEWWKGKIRLRNALFNSYSLSAIVGPGNEHVIARHLLIEALRKGSKHQIQRMIRLGLGLCQRLMHIDRFRDAMIACGAMVHLLKETNYKKDYVEALRLQARAFRMVNRQADAVDSAILALDEGDSIITDDTKADLQLTLALSYKQMSQSEDALQAARAVLDLTHRDSNDGHQARSVITELSLKGLERDKELIELEHSARTKGHVVAANNIVINLASKSANVAESLQLLDKVIRSAKDNYNRTRAIIEKATVLNVYSRIGELSESDRSLLGAAYSYSYSQRIGKMLDRCHKVLWDMFMREKMLPPLLRLFRFSSLTWRLTDHQDQDVSYLKELDTVDIERMTPNQQTVLHFEIHYLQRRRQDHARAPGD